MNASYVIFGFVLFYTEGVQGAAHLQSACGCSQEDESASSSTLPGSHRSPGAGVWCDSQPQHHNSDDHGAASCPGSSLLETSHAIVIAADHATMPECGAGKVPPPVLHSPAALQALRQVVEGYGVSRQHMLGCWLRSLCDRRPDLQQGIEQLLWQVLPLDGWQQVLAGILTAHQEALIQRIAAESAALPPKPHSPSPPQLQQCHQPQVHSASAATLAAEKETMAGSAPQVLLGAQEESEQSPQHRPPLPSQMPLPLSP